MKNLILLLGLLMAYSFAHTQTWDGGGNDTEWNNPLNWDTDMIPIAGAQVVFAQSVAVTASGTVLTPSQVLVRGTNTELELDLNITVGDGLTAVSAIQVNSNASLLIPKTRTLILNPPMTDHAISVLSGATNTNITVDTGATIAIILADRGINLRSSTATFTNHGIITIGQCANDGINMVSGAALENTGSMFIGVLGGDGIDNAGNLNNHGSIDLISTNVKGIRNNSTGVFTNSGLINISDLLVTMDDGIISNGTFLNDTTGVISVTQVIDDAVEILGGTFTNVGTMDITSSNAATAANSGLAVGSGSAPGTFINNGILAINAGGGANARAITVFPEIMSVNSSLDNNGLIKLSGGNPTQLLYNRGITTNRPTGTINTGDGRVNVNLGTFFNYGLLEGNYPSVPSVFTGASGTSVNDGFYRHNSTSFSNGGMGSITNNGINMNDPSQTTLDLMGAACSIMIAGDSATQTWLNTLGGSIDVGPLVDFTGALPDPNLATINAFGINVSLTVINACPAAILPIELLSFEATPQAKSVMLNWTTATELDNEYMAVERSIDARQFIEIGRVAGAGTSYLPLNYQLEDANPVTGINYYRLRQVDTDGTVDYSKIIAADFKSTNAFPTLTIAPNPVRQGGSIKLDLSQQPAESNRYYIINSQGRIISTYEFIGGSTYSIDLPNLPAGLYVFSAMNQSQRMGGKFLVIE